MISPGEKCNFFFFRFLELWMPPLPPPTNRRNSSLVDVAELKDGGFDPAPASSSSPNNVHLLCFLSGISDDTRSNNDRCGDMSLPALAGSLALDSLEVMTLCLPSRGENSFLIVGETIDAEDRTDGEPERAAPKSTGFSSGRRTKVSFNRSRFSSREIACEISLLVFSVISSNVLIRDCSWPVVEIGRAHV